MTRERAEAARTLQDAFLDRTGVTSSARPRRYLWTDAFAVGNELALHRLSGGEGHLDRALELVRQVHHVLGRHREDDPRSGWLSGLPDGEGEVHPTAGGLRIGKPLPERGPDEPPDPRGEWDRDGQYFHYLTRWIHALLRVGEVTGEPRHLRHAAELAEAACRGFAYRPEEGGPLRLRWKMSVDLSRPLVDSMGAHDPLDGWVTLRTVQAARGRCEGDERDGIPPLEREIAELETLCAGRSWATDDALGIGGLLLDLFRLVGLVAGGDLDDPAWMDAVGGDARRSLDFWSRTDALRHPARHRLPFRELGLAVGLRAVEALRDWGEDDASVPVRRARRTLERHAQALEAHLPLADRIEAFWLDPRTREASTWRDHEDINAVMLATSLVPEGWLGRLPGAH